MIVGLAVVFLAFHLPYLPKSLEDLDSINFALGVRDFDVAHHQPHPPGYPMFILIARAVHVLVPAEATALSLVSVATGVLGVLAIAALFRRLDTGTPPRWTVAAVAVAMTTPLYWFTAVRPLSDMSGLASAVAVQAMILGAANARTLAIAGFCAGLGAGLRSQVLWLTVPLLALRAWQGGAWRRLGIRAWGLEGNRAKGSGLIPTPQSLIPVMAAYLTGILLWLTPLVIVSGGPIAYWHALMDQGAEDLGNIQMLWTMHRVSDVRDALYYAFVSPWAVWPFAAVVLTCAALGLWHVARHQRQALLTLIVAFGPYLIFDLLFQETFTTRYALPLIVPLAWLAIMGLERLPWDVGIAGAIGIAMFSAHVGGTSIAAYARDPAPAFRLLGAMQAAARGSDAPVLAMDRREALDLRRPIKWVGDAMPRVAEALPSPPQHEWLEAVSYWNRGGRAPLWFVVDPARASIDLVQHGEPERFRWPLAYPVLLGGVRPNEMDWYRVDRPEWYVGEGWALTPESAGVANADRRELSRGPIDGWLDGRVAGGGLLIGGRNFEATAVAELSLLIDGQPLRSDRLAPGPFLHVVPLPANLNPLTRSKLTVRTDPGARVAIEQFDASATRPLVGFGAGWHEQEFDPRTGVRWRWLSERAELLVVASGGQAAADVRSESLTLHLEGESSRKYFSRPSMLTVRSGDRRPLTMPVTDDFAVDIPVSPGPISIETDQVFSPADRSWRRSADRRHLGLRIFKAWIRKTSRSAS